MEIVVFWLIVVLVVLAMLALLVFLTLGIAGSEFWRRYWAYYQNEYAQDRPGWRNTKAVLAISWRALLAGLGGNI
ncbi:hypothetical protein [Lacticaseibacillus brantae]|uniref:Uncharacterized protein n=1 Tax=Lacticaseibacillus brantae DSM 23927 TaxID=1423727 RepID=A0A0R2B9Y8_9LACO|nr:hypothetical protein [Lacticaseibacillus brantae]KRM72387.1 hypothetical protein FC34_GL000089 [Lacticaseibacillus brantae DSM 23927]